MGDRSPIRPNDLVRRLCRLPDDLLLSLAQLTIEPGERGLDQPRFERGQDGSGPSGAACLGGDGSARPATNRGCTSSKQRPCSGFGRSKPLKHGPCRPRRNQRIVLGLGGGERGIRTLETVTRLHTFQACAFDHSAISPAPAADAGCAANRAFASPWRPRGWTFPRRKRAHYTHRRADRKACRCGLSAGRPTCKKTGSHLAGVAGAGTNACGSSSGLRERC